MNIYIPYTYCLYHIPTNRAYYGVRYARSKSKGIAHPSDLWTTYFTSSNLVKDLIKEYGKDSFRVEVRKTFTNASDAISWETKVLTRMNVLSDVRWLNGNIAGGLIMTDEIKDKIRSSMKGHTRSYGRKCSDETKAKMSAARKGKTSPNKGKRLTDEQKNAIGQRSRNVTDEQKRFAAQQLSKACIGRKRAYRDDGSWYWVRSIPNG